MKRRCGHGDALADGNMVNRWVLHLQWMRVNPLSGPSKHPRVLLTTADIRGSMGYLNSKPAQAHIDTDEFVNVRARFEGTWEWAHGGREYGHDPDTEDARAPAVPLAQTSARQRRLLPVFDEAKPRRCPLRSRLRSRAQRGAVDLRHLE